MVHENNKKIPCGGFYLGDGLTMDGNTLKSLGGEQVQPDYTQNDPTAKDYIKNRPGGYEEGYEITWDGDTTGRVSATIGAPYAFYKVSNEILTSDQLIGSIITVIANGKTMTLPPIDNASLSENEIAIINKYFLVAKTSYEESNPEHSISIPEPGVYFLYFANGGNTEYVSSLSNIIAHPFDDKYIPDSIARKDEVYTKDKVYTKNEVYTKDEIYTNYNHTMSITWNGNTDGKDTLVWNADNYYKISDNVPAFKHIQSVSTFRSNDDMKSTVLYEGENCYRAGFSIVVTKAGACKLAPNEGGTILSFIAPSTGIYFWTKNTGAYQIALALTLFIEQAGIIVNSASKKWKIAVDDSGTISATEIPE